MDRNRLALQLLKRHLAAIALGEITETGKLVALLAGCWHQFAGTHAQGMNTGKLTRMEAPHWEPPILSFAIERHGAIGLVRPAPNFSIGAWILAASRAAASRIVAIASCSHAPSG